MEYGYGLLLMWAGIASIFAVISIVALTLLSFFLTISLWAAALISIVLGIVGSFLVVKF